MPFYRWVILELLPVLAMGSICYAQAPIIKPKTPPIILKLDATGKHIVNINDLATIANNTDSPLIVKLIPAMFDCGTTGNQSVKVTALTNGSVNTPSADKVSFKYPVAVAFDPKGNLFVAENQSFILRKITPAGIVTVFAGTGVQGKKDDPANSTSFSNVIGGGLACDNAGNIYLSDSDLGKIRKIAPDGTMSTLLAGLYKPGAIAFDKQQNLYVAETDTYKVLKITPTGAMSVLAGTGFEGHVDGDATTAKFGRISSLAVDALGNVFVGDFPTSGNTSIRKITPQGVVSTFFSPGQAGAPGGDPPNAFGAGPSALKFDEAGNLYFADYGAVKRFSPNGTIISVAGLAGVGGYTNGAGADASFTSVNAIAIDPCGNLIVADYENHAVRKITLGGVVSTFAGDGLQLTGKITAGTCQSSVSDIQVTVQTTPIFTSVYQDVVINDCAILADYTTKATATDNCPEAKIKFTQSPAPNTPMPNDAPVSVTITAIDETGGQASVSFFVTAKHPSDLPERSISISPSSTAICAGDPILFKAITVSNGAIINYQWLLNGDNVGPDAPEYTATDLKDGDIINCAATTSNGCGIPNLSPPVQISVNPLPVITLKNTEQILLGNSVILNPAVTGDIISYNWSPADGLSDANSPSPTASPVQTTKYRLTVTTSAGCPAFSDITVSVIYEITIPNAFTPNNDGVNDLWSIKYLNNYTNCTVQVYTRNGTLVHQSKGYATAWDGRYNNAVLPAGVYYYIVDLKDGSKIRSGSLTILK